jgi:hypothetical protein
MDRWRGLKDETFSAMPRRLARELEDGLITPSAFGILTYLGCAGLDRYGVSTDYRQLAARLGISTRTVARALSELRDLGYVRYALKPGQRRSFRVVTGPLLWKGLSDTTSDTTSDVTPPHVVHGHLARVRGQDPGQIESTSASASTATWDTDQVTETETDPETNHSSLRGGWSPGQLREGSGETRGDRDDDDLDGGLDRHGAAVDVGGDANPLIGDENYLPFLFQGLKADLLTEAEWRCADRAHRFVHLYRRGKD